MSGMEIILSQMNWNAVVGFTTDHCVSKTTRNFEYDTYLISIAITTFEKLIQNDGIYYSEFIHNNAVANLGNEFAKLISSRKFFNIY